MKTKNLYLIRHAHRDTSQRQEDNGLDEKGLKQEALLRKYFLSELSSLPPKELDLQSSPKARCQETLAPLSQELHKSLFINPLLDERQVDEDSRQFIQRVRQFLRDFETSAIPICLACSHGDWIPVAIKELTDVSTEIGKSGWVQLQFEEGQWRLQEIVAHWKELPKLL